MLKIKSMLRLYRAPIIFTVCSIAGLCWWFHDVPRRVNALGQKRNSQTIIGTFNLIASTIQGLSSRCRIQEDSALQVLENIVENTILWYAIVQRDGQDLIHTSRAPVAMPLSSDAGHQVVEGQFLYWRKIKLSCHEHYEMQVEQATTLQPGSSADVVLVLGGEIPRDRQGFEREIKGRHLGLAVVFFSVAASALVWVMAIRHRLIFEKLENKRLRLKHFEELSLAAAGLAHETKNPLGIISAIAQQISRRPDITADSLNLLGQVVDEVDNASARLGHFMNFARPRKINPATIEASHVITRVTRVLTAEFDEIGVKLKTNCPRMWIIADEKVLGQILVNLLLNSLRASVQGGKVLVCMTSHGYRATLEVEDWGNGIPPSLLPKVFKPYVTGSAAGHGLGLAIVKRHVEQHGWTIRMTSDENKGTLVVISGILLKRPVG